MTFEEARQYLIDMISDQIYDLRRAQVLAGDAKTMEQLFQAAQCVGLDRDLDAAAPSEEVDHDHTA
jgi:hypothetical protein